MIKIFQFILSLLLLTPGVALAYLGPGLGLAASVVLTLLALSIFFSLCYLVYATLRGVLMRRQFRGKKKLKVSNDL